MSAGGARTGAGRKVGYRKPGARRHLLTVKVSEEERALALALGDGNASDGVRVALAQAARRREAIT